jgi:hypothetical protein
MKILGLALVMTAALPPEGALAAAGDDLAARIEALATPSGVSIPKAPAWVRGGFVYRISTPDDADVLPALEEELTAMGNLLDGTVRQIPIINGLIGHDHRGPWNWDGLWPYWGRVTYRAGSWDALSASMRRLKERANVAVSFHLNLTDVNVGLRDYPESRAFFEKLVETKSIYRRDCNTTTRARDQEPPYVPRRIPPPTDPEGKDPVGIFALVNYKRFWDSGLARDMIDSFYARLPYPPPILYLDVLNLSGGNFSTGFPDGPLGGSERTQLEGVLAIAGHLRAKGTDVATEGLRAMLGERATYVWLHGRGWSRDDYSVIDGGYKQAVTALAWQHVAGNMGAFNVSPIASQPEGRRRGREHEAALAAGRPSPKRVAGLGTRHIAFAFGDSIGREYDIPGTSDPFRGDWADLLGNFYLTAIQELYHIGKGNVRAATFRKIGILHVREIVVTGEGGSKTTIPAADAMATTYDRGYIEQARRQGEIMLEQPLVARFRAPGDGIYRIRCLGLPNRDRGALNLYVDQKLHHAALDVTFEKGACVFDDVRLAAGEHEIAIDAGPLYARWSDGTTALWATPYLGTGLRVVNGDVVFADDYDRMWPDTWSGRTKIHFFSWNGTERAWKLPVEWSSRSTVTLHPLTSRGRGEPVRLKVTGGSIAPKLRPQVPYILLPE